MINNSILFTNYKKKILCLYIEDGVPKDLQLYNDEDINIRSVYIGKVKNIVKNIDAAFIEIAPGQNCFMKLEELDKIHVLNRERTAPDLKQGDDVLVQIVKGAVKDKAPVCTGKIKLPKDVYEHVLSIAPTRTCHSVLYSAKPKYLTFLQQTDLANIDKITCIDDTIYQEVDGYIAGMTDKLGEEKIKDIRKKISIYSDAEYPVNKLYKIDSLIAELTCHKLWLKSGANVVIDYTEAMTVIDVNSAKSIADKHPDHILRINIEAANEIFRQIRLRNLSGMILIDFINDEKAGTDELIHHVKELANKDNCECRYVDITGLGIVELTRKKLGRPIYELL